MGERRPDNASRAAFAPLNAGRSLLVAALVASAAILVIGLLFAVKARDEAQAEARESARLTAVSEAAGIDRFLSDRIAFLEGVARQARLAGSDRNELRRQFRAMLAQRTLVDDLGWVDADGRGVVLPKLPVARTRNIDLSERDYVRAIRRTGRPFISDGLVSRIDPAPLVVIAVPSQDGRGRLRGIVTGPIRLDVLRPPLERLRGAKTIEVIDGGGRRIVADSPVKRLAVVENRPLLQKIDDGAGVLEAGRDLEGRADRVVSFAQVPSSGWTVVTSTPIAEAYDEARSGFELRMVAWSAAVVLLLVAAWLLARRINRAGERHARAGAGLFDASAALNSSTTVAEVLDAFGRHVATPLDAVFSALVLIDRDEIIATSVSAVDTPESEDEHAVEMLARRAAVTDARVEQRDPGGRGKGSLQAGAAVPLPGVPGVSGAIAVGLARGDALSEREWDALEVLAGQVSQAFVRARLLEHEHDTAIRLQRALLPARLPRTPGVELAARYRPGERGLDVGGDWYEAVALPCGRLAFAVGDIVGHGLDAAVAMGQVRTAFAALASTGRDVSPVALLDLLDEFVRSVPGAESSTVVCGVLDPRSGELRLAAAGQSPPLLVDARGTVAEHISDGRSWPLAVDPAPRSRGETSLQLEPGATVLCYSDGLIERRGEVPDAGLARLRAAAIGAVSGSASLDAMCAGLVEEMVDDHPLDDVVVLAVRWLGVPAVVPVQTPA